MQFDDTENLSEFIKYNLTNAYVSYEVGELVKAKNFLEPIKAQELPTATKIKFLTLYGDVEIDLGNQPEAIEFLTQALHLLESQPEPSTITKLRILNSIGAAYFAQNNFRMALQYQQRCWRMVENEPIEDDILTINIYRNMGNSYYRLGENQKAKDSYLTAILLSEKKEPSRQLAGIYWGIGLVCKADQELEDAKKYFTHSILLYERFNQLNEAITVKGLLGGMLTDAKDFTEAEIVLKSALATASQLQDAKALWLSNLNLGVLYVREQTLEKAEPFIESSISWAEQSGNKYLLAQSIANLADLKLTKGDEASGLELYKKAVEEIEQTDEIERASRINFRFAEALVKAGKVNEAVEYYRKACRYYIK